MRTHTVLLYGLATWIAPFVVSLPRMGPAGAPRIDMFLFKSIMLLIGMAVGAFLLVRLLSVRRPNPGSAGLKIGLVWCGMNLALDMLILVPLSGMRLNAYVNGIGLRYLLIPIIAWAMGTAISRSHRPRGEEG